MTLPSDDYDHTSLPVAKLRFYDEALAAINLPLSSANLEVIALTDFNEFDGQATDNYIEYTSSTTNAQGQSIEALMKVSNTIKASWLPFGSANRLTPPNIRRGERVMLWQLGDSDKYYWTTSHQDRHLRRLETAIYAFSATPQENATLDATNQYFFEISAHKKLIGLYTSKANSEPYAYRIQINTGEGWLSFQDDVGNFIQINSKDTHIEIGNAAQTLLSLFANKLSIFSNEAVSIETKAYNLKCQSSTVDCTTSTTNASSCNINAATRVGGTLHATGNITSDSADGAPE